jgi:CheY-like chemotaxis protein
VATASEPTPVALVGVTALVVDDHPDSRELLAEILQTSGAGVVQCDSAASTIAVLESTPVHLLVADLGLPGTDGFALIREVRRMAGYHGDLAAVAVSAYSRPEDRDTALAAGFNGYCPKPVDPRELLRVIDGVLSETRSASG